jgi:hypothetical protein
MEIGKNENTRAEARVMRFGRQPREEDQCVVIGSLPQALPHITGVDDVMVHPERIEPRGLCVHPYGDDVEGVLHTDMIREDESEFHRISFEDARRLDNRSG